MLLPKQKRVHDLFIARRDLIQSYLRILSDQPSQAARHLCPRPGTEGTEALTVLDSLRGGRSLVTALLPFPMVLLNLLLFK